MIFHISLPRNLQHSWCHIITRKTKELEEVDCLPEFHSTLCLCILASRLCHNCPFDIWVKDRPQLIELITGTVIHCPVGHLAVSLHSALQLPQRVSSGCKCTIYLLVWMTMHQESACCMYNRTIDTWAKYAQCEFPQQQSHFHHSFFEIHQ